MPDELPKGWVTTTLSEIRHDESIALSREQMRGETFELYSVPAFSDGEPEVVAGDAIGSNKLLVSPGDVLLCKINPRINRAWVVGEPHGHRQIASTEWIVFSKQKGISSEFLRYFFSQDTFRDYLAANVSGVGGSLMRVSPNVVRAHPFPLPPLAEQERIVAKLDAALSGVARAENATHRAQERLKRYRAGILDAAVTGELTRDWRERKATNTETGADLLQHILAARRAHWEEAKLQRLRSTGKEPKEEKWKSRYPEPVQPRLGSLSELPENWGSASVDQLAAHEERSITDGPFGSNLKSSHYTDAGPRVVRLQNIGEGIFLDERIHISPEHYATLMRYAVFAGDLVIRALGTPLPVACMIPEWLGPAIVKADCIRFKVASEYVAPKFVMWALNSPSVRARTEKMIHGIGRPRLNLGEIKSIALPVPPLAEQAEIVRELERRLAAANQLATTLQRQLARARATRQSLMREAITGHLVPQNPMDEPASVLLDRIRAAREAEAQKPKGTRMPKSKSPVTRRSLLDVLRENERPMKLEHLFNEAGFTASQVDLFYRELTSLRDKLKVDKPKGSNAKSWPYRAHVMLKLKEN